MRPPETLHRSRDTSVLLRAGLNLIQQALSIYSDDLTLIAANRQFKTMFGLPDWLVEPGAKFSDTLTYLASQGEYGDVGDVAQFVEERVAQALAFEPHYVERKRANGRWISVEGGPLRQGGWVTVYTDITEIKDQEQMLRSHSADLSSKLLDRSEELARANRALEATITRLHETQQHLEAAEARVRLAAETTPAHIARLSQAERYTYSNQRLPLRAANGAEDIIGHHARDVLGEEIYNAIAPAMQSALRGDPKVVEFPVPADGRQIRAAFTPDTNASNVVTGVYVLSMDVTPNARPLEHSTTAQFGTWTAHFNQLRLVSETGAEVAFSVSEAALLKVFLATPNRLLSRDEIFSAPKVPRGSDRALDVRISRLRQKIGDDPKSPTLIRTIYGAGYMFVGEVAWQA
ncbi:MAG: PAS-domain containing protein [Pseudomonadota bacterium]